jgi:WhiB family redox-sensing transcriptional regulator
MLATQAIEPTETEPTSVAWETRAACRQPGVPAGLFFSENLSDIASAKRICAECPVMSPCLEQAIHNEEPWGVWGGQLFCNGKMLMVKRRRGRPPKHPRPEDQIPLIPIPDHLRDLVRTA